MALNEGPCYTIINSKDSEPFNEMQIKQDLGELLRFRVYPSPSISPRPR